MLISVKCKKCNNHYPLRDINQHIVQCEKEEMVSASAKEHNNTVLYCNLQEISDNLEAKEVINLGRTTHYTLIGNFACENHTTNRF